MDEVAPAIGTLLGEICGTAPLAGEYFCNFETNADYVVNDAARVVESMHGSHRRTTLLARVDPLARGREA